MEGAVMTPAAGADQPRAVAAERGLAWWTEAWALFMKNAGLWIVIGLIFFVILVVLGFIPLLGGLAACLLMPVFVGGWMLAARKTEEGAALEVGDLFAAFKGDKLTPLIVVGAIFLAMAIVIGVVMMVLGMGSVAGLVMGGAGRSGGGMMAGLGLGLFAVLAAFVLGALASMAVWFAPALVALRGTAPVEAMKASFAASLRNIVPFMLWLVIYIGAAIVASIPLGLGWIVLGPLLLLTLYTAYKDIFEG
ncbi:MAG: hypothetical protein JNL85_06065 [Rubrivivax sp.]|nr:hypothetical protein [Rubrivivax sp.]